MKKIIALILIFTAVPLFLYSCGGNSNPAGLSETSGENIEDVAVEYIKITGEEAYDMMNGLEDYILLDVRTYDEYSEKYIAGAVLIPDYELKDRAETELPDKNVPIFLYCRTGRRSAEAAKMLIGMGYKKVYDFGGIYDWPYKELTASIKKLMSAPTVRGINAPVAGNYPQGLYKYPSGQGNAGASFEQTLEWLPKVEKVFAADTQYTAVFTLTPTNKEYSYQGMELEKVKNLPENNVSDITMEIDGDSMIIKIAFEKTASTDAELELLFYDDFDGDKLDGTKWELCPNWDRQGRATWDENLVSVSGGYLHLGLVRDEELGASKTSVKNDAKNWIRGGAVRTMTRDYEVIFENTYGYYEARIKFPKVKGTWGAFWLMSPTMSIITGDGVIGTEIDIVESIHNENNRYNAALHWDGYGDSHKAAGSGDGKLPVDIYDGGFHTFALDWSPGEYIFYVDDIEFWRCDGGRKFQNCGINQNPNYMKLTVEGAEWAGTLPADFTEDEMLVDYVRVYKQPKIR